MDDDALMRRIRGTELEAVLLAALEAGGQITASAASEAVGSETAGDEATSGLIELGLVSSQQSMASEVTLTTAGARVAEKIRASHQEGPERRDAVQRALLRFIRDENPHSTEDFVGHDAAKVNGRPADVREVIDAGNALLEYRLIKVVRGPMGFDFQLRPEATIDGVHSLDEHSATLRQIARGDHVATSTSYNQTFGDNATIGAVAQGSTVGSIAVTQSITVNERNLFNERMAAVLEALPADSPADLRQQIAELEAAGRDESTPKQTLMEKVMQAVFVAAGSEAGRQIIELLHQVGAVLM